MATCAFGKCPPNPTFQTPKLHFEKWSKVQSSKMIGDAANSISASKQVEIIFLTLILTIQSNRKIIFT